MRAATRSGLVVSAASEVAGVLSAKPAINRAATAVRDVFTEVNLSCCVGEVPLLTSK